jgi:hypothetical protein
MIRAATTCHGGCAGSPGAEETVVCQIERDRDD